MPPNNKREFMDNDDKSKDECDDDLLLEETPSGETNTGSNISSDDDDSSSSWKPLQTKESVMTETDVSETCYGDSFLEDDGLTDDSEHSTEGLAPDSKPPLSSIAAATAAAAATSLYAIEKCRQRKLTKIPLVMGQLPQGSQTKAIHDRLTATQTMTTTTSNRKGRRTTMTKTTKGILNRPIVPSLWVGTRGDLASAAAYQSPGIPSSKSHSTRFSETLVVSQDGAQIHLDWEVPNDTTTAEYSAPRRDAILSGTIDHPTILILHGVNNSSDYGYIRNQQRAATAQGWNAVAMNFRGCAAKGKRRNHPIPMTTPRSYTASYTGDLRSVVRQLAARMVMRRSSSNNSSKTTATNACLVLIGNSLGGNLVTKYLGEEGLANTLPKQVLGGISLGAPLRFRSDHLRFPFKYAIGAARKLHYFRQRKAMGTATTTTSGAFHWDPRKISLQALDRELAPTMIRTTLHPPYETKIGYGHAKRNTENVSTQSNNNEKNSNAANKKDESTNAAAAQDYWENDSGCYQQGSHASVPLLHVISRDDNLCYGTARQFLGYALRNPNVMVVQTRTGGHLGWWHVPQQQRSSSSWWGLDSWADELMVDFVRALLDTQSSKQPNDTNLSNGAINPIEDAHELFASLRVRDNEIAAAAAAAVHMTKHRCEHNLEAAVTILRLPPSRLLLKALNLHVDHWSMCNFGKSCCYNRRNNQADISSNKGFSNDKSRYNRLVCCYRGYKVPVSI